MRVRSIQSGFFIALLALVTFAFFVLVRGFFEPIVWAATLAVVFYPLYRRILRRVGERETIATVLTVIVILLAVILPVTGLSIAVVAQGQMLYAQATEQGYDVEQVVRYYERTLPLVRDALNTAGINAGRIEESIAGAAASVGQFVAAHALTYTQSALTLAVMFVVMLYLLYFFIKDGPRILGSMMKAFPLGDEHERKLLTRFAVASRATIKGSIIVGIVQGTLGGLAFGALGVQGAVFWGVVMMVASLIPTFGTAIVWLPAAIVLLATGHPYKALILFIWGSVVIGMVDNFLRPALVGRDTQVPDWIVLLTTLGGIAIFGFSGILIGPIVAALFLTTWQLFAEEFDYAETLQASDVVVVKADEELLSVVKAEGTAPSGSMFVDPGAPAERAANAAEAVAHAAEQAARAAKGD
ncbi:MAG TPA: AI-2E family transporter [Rhodothermales bacterium]|nr:AI-2E family transporter [Rhodothermales bacterium]